MEETEKHLIEFALSGIIATEHGSKELVMKKISRIVAEIIGEFEVENIELSVSTLSDDDLIFPSQNSNEEEFN